MMIRALTCLALLMPSLPALADGSLPREVQKFVDRREGCDHMRGEVPESDDKQRMREVDREIKKLCKGTDEQLVQLKKRYASNASVIRRLNEFEQGIEASKTSVSSSTPGR